MLRRRLTTLWSPWPVAVNGAARGRDAARPAPLSRLRSARCASLPGPVMDYGGIKEMLDKQARGFEGVALPTRLNNPNE